jgi:hypothetical protein
VLLLMVVDCLSMPVIQVRLNFLSKLLPEAQAHLAQVLTASVLGVKLFNMPFHRHVKITAKDMQGMQAALLYCQQV